MSSAKRSSPRSYPHSNGWNNQEAKGDRAATEEASLEAMHEYRADLPSFFIGSGAAAPHDVSGNGEGRERQFK
jgi:hypothetical protein